MTTVNPITKLSIPLTMLINRWDESEKCYLCDEYGHNITNKGKRRYCYDHNSQRDQAKKKLYRLIERWKNANIPCDYMKKRVGNFKGNVELKKKVIPLINRVILFSGDVGLGKTHLAIGLLRKAMLEGKSIYYQRLSKLLMDMRQSFSSSTKKSSEKETIDKYLGYGCLVIDEVGRQPATEYSVDILFELVAGRIEEKKPTILISNLDYKQLTETYIGKALQDRLYQYGKVFPFVGESWRKKNGRSKT